MVLPPSLWLEIKNNIDSIFYFLFSFPRFRLLGGSHSFASRSLPISPKPSYEAPPYDVVGAASRGGEKGKELCRS